MSKQLQMAVIGCSDMAMRHMEGIISDERCVLYGICDVDPAAMKKAADKFAPLHQTENYRDFVDDPAVDAAVIVTPDNFHPAMVEAFLRAGKAVLCEKPMALSTDECQEMMQVEKDTNGKLMIGQCCRCNPMFIKAKEIIDAGRIGELFYVESEYAHNYENSKGVGEWRMDPRRHSFIGGACHAVDLLRWIAGDPTEVSAYANHKIMTDWPTDDCVIAMYKFPQNVIGKVFCSIGCNRSYTMRSVFYGSLGTVICESGSGEVQLFTRTEPLPDGKIDYHVPQRIPVPLVDHNAKAEIVNFADALLSGGKMPVPSSEGARTIAVCCSTVEASQKGTPVVIRYPEVR